MFMFMFFEPGKSEDEAVPRNIKIARNLQKTQTDMVKQVEKTRREGDYQIGDWLSLDKEPRAGLSKMDAVQYRPFKVGGRCKKRPANYDILYLAIPGSNKSAHTEHLRIWPGIGEKWTVVYTVDPLLWLGPGLVQMYHVFSKTFERR